jgi:parvulin-like peptidyl-prolyl isomerase
MSNEYLFTINNHPIDLKSAFNCLRGLDDTVLSNLIQIIVGRQYALEKGITISDEELQIAVDEFRYLQGMESADSFKNYLKNRKISLLSFQNAMENILLISKLTDDISDEEASAYINDNYSQFQSAELYMILIDNESKANDIIEMLKDNEEELNFPSIAFEHSLDNESKKKGGYIGFIQRNLLTSEIETAVFNASEGEILGPFKAKKGYNIFMVNSFHKPAKDDPELILSIKQQLLQEKIKELMQSAEIQCPFYE